jgi:hypothetical protein
VATALAAAALSLGGCTSGTSNSAPSTSTDTDSVATTSTVVTTTVAAPEPLSHREFIKRLDHVCRQFNTKLDRRFGAAEDAAIAANDYGRLADLRSPRRRTAEGLDVPGVVDVELVRHREVAP